jgi:hypothetical protein
MIIQVSLDQNIVGATFVLAPPKFLQNNQGKFQTSEAVHSLHARIKYHLYRSVANVLCIERSLYCAGIRIFDSVPHRLTNMLNKKAQFKVVLRRC